MKELIVDIDVSEKKYLISKYSEHTMAPELKEYIMNELVGVELNKKVILNIHAKFNVNDDDKENYSNIIRKEFKETLNELIFENGSSDVKKLSLFFLGILFIVASYLFIHILGEIISQVFTVFGWVALWEVAYSIFFTDAKRRRKIKRLKQALNSKINFM